MKKQYSVCLQLAGILSLFLLMNSFVVAHDKVVIVPLGGGCGTLQQFTINRDGTVTDNLSRLMWQQADDGNTYNWYEAAGVNHATYNPGSDVCGVLGLGGHFDWRLPTQDELRGLIVCTNGNEPIVNYPDNPNFCGDGNSGSYDMPTIHVQFSCRSSYYWSSSTYDADHSWMVYFANGNAVWGARGGSRYVRCVR